MIKTAHVILLCSAAAAMLSLLVVADDACGEHGHLDAASQSCVCDQPWPGTGDKGWTGKNCTIPVYSGDANGEDMTSWCASNYNCNTLQGGEWGCFAISFQWNSTDDPWNYLSILMERTSEEGDPDLFGLWAGGSRGAVAPNASAKGYDFQETSSGLRPLVVKTLSKAEFGADHDYEGAYLCVRSYGPSPTSFALRATLDRCPSGFDDDGTPLLCGSRRGTPEAERRYSECSQGGECVCRGAYAKPVPEVYPDVGFQDCTAEVTEVELGVDNHTWVGEHQEVGPNQWRFYHFKLHQRDYQVVVDLAGEQAHGYLDMYMKYGSPPSWGPNQFDLRPQWNAALDDRQMEVVLDPSQDQFRAGSWFVGVVGDSGTAANFTLTINKYDCPLNCSGHGDCVAGAEPHDRRCQCWEGYGGRDCSKSTAALRFGVPVSHGLRAFEYDYYMLPESTPGMARGSVEVLLEASFWSDGYTHHMGIHPALLLAPSDGSTFPSASNYTDKLVMDAQNTTRTLTLCPSQLAKGQWKLAVYNPMRINSLAYNLTLSKQGLCLNNCTGGHGTCNDDGLCECKADWTGGDCSVSLNASCVAGSRRGVPRPDQHGTCWQECSCNGEGKECAFGDSCADFTCDPGPAGGLPWRRKGGELECVQDACVKDLWVHTPQYVCLRNCTCPPDGSPCTLDARCSHRVELSAHSGWSGGAVFGWVLVALVLGGVGVLGYVHYMGVPTWLPIRSRGFGGLYQELSGNEGV